MPERCLKFVVVAMICLVSGQASAQAPLPLPAEIDATSPEHADSARKAAEAKVDAAYGAAVKKCDALKGAEKSACAAQAEAEQARGKAEINAPLRATPEGRPPTGSTK